MSRNDVEIYITAAIGLTAGIVAVRLGRGSGKRFLIGFTAALFFSSAIIFVPRFVSSFRLWRYIPQEVSLHKELLIDGVLAFVLAGLFVGTGCAVGLLLLAMYAHRKS
jgi:hypothetical protein